MKLTPATATSTNASTWTRHRIGALAILQHLAAAGAVCHDSFFIELPLS